MNRVYLCIDLKTFYASVECVERNLDPFKTDLVVADKSRGDGTICLAISPKMKLRGIKNRCRMWEIPKRVKPIIAKPRMILYMKYSAKIYEIYLKYVDKKDIHYYSIDEAFLDITTYLNMYKKTPIELAKIIMEDIKKTTGISSATGIGTNMYLSKIALDITAKHSKDSIGYLDEEKYKQELWHHLPLTDFWQIGRGIETRLNKLHLKDMYDIAHCDEKKLYKEFGINAELIIDHSKGIETCTITDIKAYKTKSKSVSNSQILKKDYNYIDARKILIEMIDALVLKLVGNDLCTSAVGVCIGYTKDVIPPLKFSKRFEQETDSFTKILNVVLAEYDYRIKEDFLIRRIIISFGDIKVKKYEQLSLFATNLIEEQDNKIEKVMNLIKSKFGNNAILRGVSFTEGANQRYRNKLVGGHNAE